MSGHTHQILLLIRGGSRGQILSTKLKWFALYGGCGRLCLTGNMRLSAIREDTNANIPALEFPMYLRIGEGTIGDSQGYGIIKFHLTSSVLSVRSIDNLISFAYEDIDENYRD